MSAESTEHNAQAEWMADVVCPLFLGRAVRLHPGLPDPAAAVGNPEDELHAFRAVRDELHRRPQDLFAAWPAIGEERRS